MAKITKSYSLSKKSIESVKSVQKQHGFESESAALEYILNYQLDEKKIEDLVYSILIKALAENSISFNPKTVQNTVKNKVDDEVQKAILESANDIFDKMPEE